MVLTGWARRAAHQKNVFLGEKLIDNNQIAKTLNSQIIYTETLCDIIKTRAADFNHVNVATAIAQPCAKHLSTAASCAQRNHG